MSSLEEIGANRCRRTGKHRGPDAGARATDTTFALGSQHSPAEITKGPDGNMWFTDPSANSIGRVNLSLT